MNKQLLCVVAVAVIGAMPTVEAKDEGAKIGSFGIGASTNGLGVDYAYGINPYIDLRAGYDFGSLSSNFSDEETGLDFSPKLKFSSGRLLVDIKPFAGGFHITAGMYLGGGPKLSLKSSGLATDIDLAEQKFNADVDANAAIDFSGSAPYFGIGWGGTTNAKGFGFSSNIGVIFTGASKISFKVPNGFACNADQNSDCDPRSDGFDVTGDSAEAVAFREAVEAERQDLADDIGKLKFWPVVRFTLHYRF